VLLAHQFTAVDDQGTSYQFSASLGPGRVEWSGVLDLHPDPPHELRWLDLSTTPGQPATRIDLNSRQARPAPPEITVTPAAVSPGELLLTGIATGFLALASPEQVPLHPSAARPGPLSQAADGLADIIAALQAPWTCAQRRGRSSCRSAWARSSAHEASAFMRPRLDSRRGTYTDVACRLRTSC